MKIEEKLESFSKKVMAEAEHKNSLIIEKNDADLQRELEQTRQLERRKAEDALRLAKHQAIRQHERAVAAAKLESKKKLISRRSEMLNVLFDNVRRRLEEFIKTAEYADYLMSEIKPLTEKYQGLTVRLCQNDMKYASMITDAFNVDVKPSDNDFFGGFIAYTTGRGVLDHSFKSRLERERERFNLIKVGV